MARRGNFVCAECGDSKVAPMDQFSESMEYRRMDMKERLYRKTLRLVCRRCVLEKKHAGEGEQTSLLDAPPPRFASDGGVA